jgi:hypothetical protein
VSVAFWPPSYRAGTSDLSIQISPLGLVDLSNEEMDVHGIRLSRYSLYWAHYLGHHWAYRREIGEPQFTFNYVRALSDYLTNFTFGRGVTFQSPPATSAIIPAILKRVWEQDNRKASILWEMGQIASVTGDLFVKVAYEDPFVDSAGRLHPGRVRILPLNPANCFPQWHEHDRQRMLSFKLKYRFFSTDQTGTRIVNTYIERITDTGIEEYVNDELISARPNPLGVIPIVYVPNILISGSPWGMSDIAEIIPLNREYNEKAVEISDIVNYHSAPVTVITGAKVPQLEKGARKTWFLPKDAKVETLQSTWQLEHMLGYMDVVKRGMHEMTGVPEQALGQVQPISNTSGVALAIQYAPTMQRFRMKKNNFESGFQQINELVILTLFQKEPQSMMFNPMEDTAPKPGQLTQLDPADPNSYETSTYWPEPLPVDILVKLNEITQKMQLGLESKRGALADLGEEFPDDKLAEIFAEILEDAKDQGALQLQTSAIQAAIVALTGMVPATGEPADPGGGGGDGQGVNKPDAGGTGTMPGLVLDQNTMNLMNELTTRAYMPRMGQFRNPANTSNE